MSVLGRLPVLKDSKMDTMEIHSFYHIFFMLMDGFNASLPRCNKAMSWSFAVVCMYVGGN